VQLAWGPLLVAGFVLIPAIIGLWVAAVPIRKAHRMRRIESDPGSDKEAPVEQRRLRMEANHRLPVEERLTSAARDLAEAHATLVAAEALLRHAASLSWWDIAGLAFDRGRAKQSAVGAAARQMRTAQRLIADAVQTLRMNSSAEPIEFDERSLLLDLDTAWFGDGLMTSLAVHQEIKKAHQQATRMRLGIEDLVQKVSSSR
jgi:hypothetical protein